MKKIAKEVRWSHRPYDGYATRDALEPDADFLHVGPNSLAGEYLRRFWHPVAMTSQLEDGTPLAIRILGEDLVIFKDRGGRIGLLHKHCAHRRASLEFGRIEQRGIRCCYHGWHYDVDGTILETPGEPADSQIKNKICQGAYPVHETHGLVFAYMGPPEEMTSFPHLDSLNIPGHELVPYAIHSPNNWLQETENAIDPFHSVFLHGRISGPQFPGLEHFTELPVVEYRLRAEGITYAHARRSNNLVRLRFHDYLLPNLAQNGGMFQVMDKPKIFGRTSLTKWVVPLDDTNSRKFGWRHFNECDEVLRQGDRSNVGWETVDFYGQTAHRSYQERQRNPGDWDAWTSQGPMNIHKREYLGSTDRGVGMLRARLKRDMKKVANGQPIVRPLGSTDNPFRTHGGDTVLLLPPHPQDDKVYIESVINSVMDTYQESEQFDGDERIEYLEQQIRAKFPEAV